MGLDHQKPLAFPPELLLNGIASPNPLDIDHKVLLSIG
jgi:hypothetical protein